MAQTDRVSNFATESTRRGRRGGQRKLKPVEVCMGRGIQKSKHLSQLNGFKNSELQEEYDLHNAILLSLNIQKRHLCQEQNKQSHSDR